MQKRKKVIVIGSGPIKIAEAAEFDYSGSQALRVLKEEGIESILINSNVATVQTSYDTADKVYLLPVSHQSVEKVIEKERPWGIMVGFGGQTALNVGVELYKNGTLEKFGVKVLGISIQGIETALSREKFKETMREANIPVPPSLSARTKEVAIKGAIKIGYPVMIRVSFNLGGRGSAVVWNQAQLKDELDRAFAQSSVGEILVEKYLHGWKEIEFEVVRDSIGNCAVTACLENLDPMGIHTGDSVVVAPAQTLDNYEYQCMRSISIKVAEQIGLIGECNVQFALSPDSYEFYVIETNPRMSRSSALASKATGYPLAYVSAKLSLGYNLYDIKNSVSKVTTALFEPSLDYITIKMPRWDLNKFDSIKEEIGTEMKSIGEVMAIGRNFEESIQKAIRMLDIGEPGIVGGKIYKSKISSEELEDVLSKRRPYWFLYAAKAFKEGFTINQVYEVTRVDKFFLHKIKNIVDIYEKLGKEKLTSEKYLYLKSLGFSDEQLDTIMEKKLWIKQIDTLAGEWPAKTNYVYTTYNGISDDISNNKKKKLLVLGAGVFRIGVSVEFDYSAVAIAQSARKYFDEISLINCNPETVSTDWYRVDKLYFDELTQETIFAINEKEKFTKVAVFAAGQIGNNLSLAMEEKGIKLLGTSGANINIAENREKFSNLLDKLNVKQPEWINASSLPEVKKFIEKVGFPILIRPSYILSGSAIKVANNMQELELYVAHAINISPKYPITISKFIKNALEAELDCASDGENVIGISMVHIEEAGVHSGDATIVTPYVDGGSTKEMQKIALNLVNELKIRGPFNLQFIVEKEKVYVIELNLRASRSMPFSSKSVGINLIDYAVKGTFEKFSWKDFYEPKHNAIAIKSAQFSWAQLKGAYPYLGPEMRSTGESASLSFDFDAALAKSWLGAQPNKIPKKGVLIYGQSNLESLSKAASVFAKQVQTYTLQEAEVKQAQVLNLKKALELIDKGNLDLLITDGDIRKLDYSLRRKAADFNVPLVLNARLGEALSSSIFTKKLDYGELKDYWTK